MPGMAWFGDCGGGTTVTLWFVKLEVSLDVAEVFLLKNKVLDLAICIE